MSKELTAGNLDFAIISKMTSKGGRNSVGTVLKWSSSEGIC